MIEKLFYYSLLLLMVLFTTIGQVMFKKASMYLPDDSKKLIVSFIFKKDFIFALFFTFLAPVFYLIALKKIDLAVAYSFTSLNYVSVVLASKYFLNEEVGVKQIIATLLILLGIVFYML